MAGAAGSDGSENHFWRNSNAEPWTQVLHDGSKPYVLPNVASFLWVIVSSTNVPSSFLRQPSLSVSRLIPVFALNAAHEPAACPLVSGVRALSSSILSHKPGRETRRLGC